MKILNKTYWLHLLDIVLKKPQAKHGLIPYTPSGLDEIHYKGKDTVLGNAKTILNPTKDWRLYLPLGEEQARGNTETMSCVSHSACNAIEIIVLLLNTLDEMGQANEEQKGIVQVFKHFGILRQVDGVWRANSSDRYVAKMSGTGYNGNTLKAVADAIRHYGLIPDEKWSFVEGWNNYYSEVPLNLQNAGIKLSDYIDFNYEWASNTILLDSLQYAPTQNSVFAWNGTRDGVYYRVENPLNHAITRVAFLNDNIYIFDSYQNDGNYEKRTAKNFKFGYDLIYTLHLKKKLDAFNQEAISGLLARGFKFVMRTDKANGGKGEIYELKDGQLVELTLTDKLNEMVKNLTEQKDLTGISEELYLRLNNL